MRKVFFLVLFSGFLALTSFPGTAKAQTADTVVTFDNPVPSGAADSYLNGIYQGINFGTNQWRWSGPYSADPTRSIYFSSNVTSRTFTFSPAPKILRSIRVYTSGGSGTLTLSDNVGQTRTQTITGGSMQLVTTNWTQGSTTITVNYSFGWNLGMDDITYSPAGAPPPDTTSPTVSMTAPANGATVSGSSLAVSANASDNVGVVGVQFRLDGSNLGAEDTTSPYSILWDTTTASNAAHTLTAIARDAAGNTTTAASINVTVQNSVGGGAGSALRFFGNGIHAPDYDRVKIRIDDPANANPGPPTDVGATDFTIEFWMKGNLSENTASAVSCGGNNNWIRGNIIVDRDRYNQDRAFGLSIANGRLAFGVSGNGTGEYTICGTSNVLDGAWHHVAIQRQRSDGRMWMYVDGSLQAQVDGPDGDISYPDNGVPGNFCGGPCTNSDPFLVIGAEKHDAGSSYPSYSGWFDELRISSNLRYSANFSRPATPFVSDSNTVALYHFNEGAADIINDVSGVGPSQGVRRFGGNPAGPVWLSSDAPLSGGTQDTTAPSIPGNLAATVISSSQINLSWTASTDNVGVVGYRIYRDGTLINTAVSTTYQDTGLSPSTTYTYQVSAYDANNNQSDLSAMVSAATQAGQTQPVIVTFDNPSPSGGSDSLLNGVFQGINFGTGQWRWTGPYAADSTNSVYFDSNVNSRSFSFSSSKIVQSIRVYASQVNGIITLSDDRGQSISQTVSVGTMQTVTTNWSLQSNVVTVQYTGGWSLGVDDITYR